MLSVSEYAKERKVSRQRVLALIKEGKLNAVRQGKRWFVIDRGLSKGVVKRGEGLSKSPQEVVKKAKGLSKGVVKNHKGLSKEEVLTTGVVKNDNQATTEMFGFTVGIRNSADIELIAEVKRRCNNDGGEFTDALLRAIGIAQIQIELPTKFEIGKMRSGRLKMRKDRKDSKGGKVKMTDDLFKQARDKGITVADMLRRKGGER